MKFIYFLLFAFLTCESQYTCDFQRYYYSVCLIYNYSSPSCGPLYNNCPLIEEIYDTYCDVVECKVNELKVQFKFQLFIKISNNKFSLRFINPK